MASEKAVSLLPALAFSPKQEQPEGEQAVKPSRLKKHEKQSSWHAINSVLAVEAIHTLPQQGPLRYRNRLAPEQIQEEEQREQTALAAYKAVYDEVRRDVQRGSFRSLMRYLPFYRWVLLRDLLKDPLSLHQLDDVAMAAQGGDEQAQALLEAVLKGLWVAPISGRPELTEEKRRKNKKCSNLIAQQVRRGVQYYDQAWQKYRERTKNVTDPALLRKTAANLIEEKFSRKTPAKEEGKRLFNKQVENDIAGRTVRKKSR